MRVFIRSVCLLNAAFWAYLIVKGSALPPDQFRWTGLALLSVSLIAAVAADGSKHGADKRGAEQRPDPFLSAQPRPTGVAPLPSQSVPAAQDMAKYRAVLAQGKKIQAIKLLRDDFPGLGLKEAKDIVESL
ncbi:MAG: hypothetical protein ACRC20_08140 [Segniliparus sp.]|uniref:hypothetical protein n=1 Tax=Segniliparus sp. TaxID=2804064 RepID=UPI003F382C77